MKMSGPVNYDFDTYNSEYAGYKREENFERFAPKHKDNNKHRDKKNKPRRGKAGRDYQN